MADQNTNPQLDSLTTDIETPTKPVVPVVPNTTQSILTSNAPPAPAPVANQPPVAPPAQPPVNNPPQMPNDPYQTFMNPNMQLQDVHPGIKPDLSTVIPGTNTPLSPNQTVNSEDSSNVPAAAAIGAGAGYVIDKMSPELNYASDLRVKQAQANHDAAAENHGAAQDRLSAAKDAHAQTVDKAFQEHNIKKNLYEDAAEKLKSVKEKAKSMNVELEEPTTKPAGGEGTANYAKKVLGLSDYDANKAVDMSGKPGGAWDVARKVRSAESKIGPGWSMDTSRGIMTPVGSNLPPSQESLLRKEHEAAKLKHDAALKDYASAKNKWEGLSNSTPTEVKQAAKAATAAEQKYVNAASVLKNIKPSMVTKVGAAISKIPLAGPLSGAMAAGELENAREEYKKGHYMDAAMSGLAGVGGATMLIPTPQTKVAGALMSVPPLVYQGYKALRKP
jgi:hypothetical protein